MGIKAKAIHKCKWIYDNISLYDMTDSGFE